MQLAESVLSRPPRTQEVMHPVEILMVNASKGNTFSHEAEMGTKIEKEKGH